MGFRRTIYKLHKWAGLGLGLLLLLQAVTGLALVYRAPLQKFLTGFAMEMPANQGLPNIDAALATASQIFPGHIVERMTLPKAPQDGLTLRLIDKTSGTPFEIVSDPVNGQILARLDGFSGLPFMIFRLHKELFLGHIGHLVILIEGIMLTAFLVSGFYLWWQTRKHQALKIHWNGPVVRRRYDLHRVTGVIALPILVFLAVTGAVIAGKIWLSGGAPVVYASPSSMASPINPHIEVLAESDGLATIKDIRFSADGKSASILLFATDSVRPGAVNKIVIARDTGEVISRHSHNEGTTWQRIYSWMYPVHTGQVLGAWGLKQLVLTIGSLGLSIMIIFGFMLWLGRRR